MLYVLPTDDLAYQFSDTRIRPAIEDSPYLRSRVASTDNKGLKRVGQAFCYFVGSESERRALSIPADVLILDEYDRLNQRQIPKFARRLNAPTSLRLMRRFSNPSYPEEGIHALYLASDQRCWTVRCPGCGHAAPIEYDQVEGSHYVDPERALRVCGACRRPLLGEAVASGSWVPRHPASDARGYHISRLIVPREDISLLVAAHRARGEDEVQAHYNFDLGQPYAPRGGSLSRQAILSCRRDYACPDRYDGAGWVTAGVDVGKVLNVRISRWLGSDKAVALFVGEVGDFAEVDRLMDRYGVDLCLMDERPEERKAREFMAAHPGRVRLVRWSGEEQHENIREDRDQGLVMARRTWSCDQTVAAFEDQRRLLPAVLPPDYLSQCTAPHRVTETNHRGQKVARYVSTRADHYFFCETYDLLARVVQGSPAAGATIPPPMTIREQVRRRGPWGRGLS